MTARYLLRRRDVRRERAKLDGLRGKERAAQRKESRAAERELAIEVAVNTQAAKLARAQADAGDALAGAALELADQLDQAFIDEERALRVTRREASAPLAPREPVLLARVGRELAAARERGISFEVAWAVAIEPLPSGPCDAGIWRIALQGTVSAWRSAFEYGHDDAGRAVGALRGGPTDEPTERMVRQVA